MHEGALVNTTRGIGQATGRADPAQYRRCEVCKEPGADTATRMFVADSGGSHTSYAHRGCAEATGAAEVVSP